MIPYAASVGWYASWLHALTLGMSREEAEVFANHTHHINGKGFTRCLINGASGEILLSLPVEGGSAKLKKATALMKLNLSEHGNWRHVHQGALNAAYGRSPYFQHLMPVLTEVYAYGEESLSRFNSRLHEAIVTFLFGDDTDSVPLSQYSVSDSPVAIPRGKELGAMISSEISILDPLMRFGRETLLILLNETPNPSTFN
ncbi:MAG: WbqC family protein [Bacteroides sp.]|nr:WbqC family protein [Bacteroides sp.]